MKHVIRRGSQVTMPKNLGDVTGSPRWRCQRCQKSKHSRFIMSNGNAIFDDRCSNGKCMCDCRRKYVCSTCGIAHVVGRKCH